MADGSWPRFANPCITDDGVTMHFNENDMALKGHAGQLRLRGQLRRDGLRIVYSASGEGLEASAVASEAVEGTLRYDGALHPISDAIDLQGWHVYRGNNYVKTLPLGLPIPLATVLKQLIDPPQLQ